MTIRTKRGAIRRYNAIYNELRRGGGGLFGFDMPTIAITRPDLHTEIKHLQAIFNDLKE